MCVFFRSSFHFIAHTHTHTLEGKFCSQSKFHRLFPMFIIFFYLEFAFWRQLEPKENESIIFTFHVNYSIAFARFLCGWTWFATQIDTKGSFCTQTEILFSIQHQILINCQHQLKIIWPMLVVKIRCKK